MKYKKLRNNVKGECSADIRSRVNKARHIQLERYKDDAIYSNAQLTPALIQKYCLVDNEGQEILQTAYEKLGLSARAHSRILKVARTIADLEGAKSIKTKHLAEAIQYRSLDRKYFS